MKNPIVDNLKEIEKKLNIKSSYKNINDMNNNNNENIYENIVKNYLEIEKIFIDNEYILEI